MRFSERRCVAGRIARGASVVVLLLLASLSPFLAAQQADVGLREAIQLSRSLRQASERMRVGAVVEYVVLNHREVSYTANMTFHYDQDRLRVGLVGHNIMEPHSIEGVADPAQHVEWLYLPGGCIEKLNHTTGITRFMQRKSSLQPDPWVICSEAQKVAKQLKSEIGEERYQSVKQALKEFVCE